MPRTAEKIEKFLFYLFLFLIPFQIRFIWIPPVGGEWDSIFLYLTDILLAAVLFLGIINAKTRGLRFKKIDLFLFLFLAVAVISVFVSADKTVSIFRWVKLLEFVLLYIYISAQFKIQNSKFKITTVLSVIFYSGMLQAILAIVQFYKQSSLGLKFIEAGKYLPGDPGVATFISGTEKVMRAYGSFPHPNVLSAFLLLAIFCLYALWLNKTKIGPIEPIGLMLLIFALFLTFSRGTILVFLFISFIFLIARFFQLRELYHTEERLAMGKRMMALALLFVLFSTISALLVLPYFKTRFLKISLQEEAIDLRFFYTKIALSIIKEKPFLGIGIGEFADFSRHYPAFLRAANKFYHYGDMTGQEIPEWLYQPAHNLYLLIASEIGIFGALLFLLFVLIKFIKSIGRIKPQELSDLIGPMIFLFGGFLILGFNDHYFWTLQSGGIMFWLALALMEKSNIKMQNDNVKLKTL